MGEAGDKKQRINPGCGARDQRQGSKAGADDQAGGGEENSPVAYAIGEDACGCLEEEGAEAGNGGGDPDAVIAPVRVAEKAVEDGQDHAHGFGLEEVHRIEAGAADQGRRGWWGLGRHRSFHLEVGHLRSVALPKQQFSSHVKATVHVEHMTGDVARLL